MKKIKGRSSNCIPITVFEFGLFDISSVFVGFEARRFAVEPKRVRAVLVETPSFVGDIFDEGEASEMVPHAAVYFDDVW